MKLKKNVLDVQLRKTVRFLAGNEPMKLKLMNPEIDGLQIVEVGTLWKVIKLIFRRGWRRKADESNCNCWNESSVESSDIERSFETD